MTLGKAFADFISLGKGRRRPRLVNVSNWSQKSQSWRLFVIFVFFVTVFVLIEARLFHLTIIQGSRHRLLSESNRTREVYLPAPRGIIFDRNGEPFVRNIPLYTVNNEQCQNQGLCQRLTVEEVKENGISLDDKRLRMNIGREYVLASASSHLLGYIGEIDDQELEELNKGCDNDSFCRYPSGSFIGRGGVEEYYDEQLRGVPGRELVEVDALGNKLRVLARMEPKKGENIKLSVDKKLQSLSFNLLAGRTGAIIISDPEGKIISLVSSPSFDPNLFAKGDPKVIEVMSRQDRPLFDRAISGLYPPGSTFKLVTAAAALEEKKISKESEFEDVGVITIGSYRFPNWYYLQYGKTDGMLNVVRAIGRSNDIFFYRAGELVGITKLAAWAGNFGVGKVLGIDLPGEGSGIMPDPDWKKREMGDKWFLGDTYHVAIGQGNLLTTPLQVNAWTNVIANKGMLCQPRVRNMVSETKNQECRSLGLASETVNLIKEGMKKACQPGGTGWPLFKFKVQSEKLKVDGVNFLETPEATMSGKPWVEIPIACKTGTAEFGDPEEKTHAWFTAFAPVEKPEIVMTVLVEGGGEGSYVAAPIAKKIFKEWFRGEN